MANTRRPPKDGHDCPYCGTTGMSESESRRHRRTHPPEERVLTCEHCGKVFHGWGAAYITHVRAHEEFEQRFWANVDKNGPGGCWIWTWHKRGGGRYGFHTLGKRQFSAYRVAYELIVGPIPEGLELDHLCRVTECVNPAHLEPVPRDENMRRALDARVDRPCPHCDFVTINLPALMNHVRWRHPKPELASATRSSADRSKP